MTKFHVISDVHLEFSKLGYHEQPDVDAVILAGDIGPGFSGMAFASKTFDMPKFYVAGNHEFYNRELDKHNRDMQYRATRHGINFLQNSVNVFEGIRIIGSTMWTDYNLYGTKFISMELARRYMSDYKHISFYDTENNVLRNLTPHDISIENFNSVDFIRNELNTLFNGPTIVVTHHAPSSLSIGEKWIGDDCNPCFASRLEELIGDTKPDYWIHGHIHNHTVYELYDTKVICNPRGYHSRYGSEKTGFINNFTITL